MKSITIKIIAVAIVIIIFLTQHLSIYAHPYVLNIGYDDCNPPTNSNGTIKYNQDGEDEMWYSIAGINSEDVNNPANNIYCEYFQSLA